MTRNQTVLMLLILLPRMAVAGPPKVSPAASTPVSIQGSYAGIKTIGQLVRDYEGDRGTHFIKFSPRDSNQVPEALKKHDCDVGLVLDSLASGGKDFHGQYEAFPLGRFVVHVAVNAKTPVHTMTLEELRDVFRGQITLWKDVSSAVGRIELYAPLPTAPESSIFQKKVMRGAPYAKELRDRSATPRRQKLSSAEVIGAIAKQSNAIGFFLHDPDEPLDKRVRVLRIARDKDAEGVPPSVAAVADGSYPLSDTFTLYLHPDAPAEARAFCEFAGGPKGAKIVRQFGLWPEYDLERVRGQQRIADVKAGRGAAITACDLAGGADVLKDLALEFVKAKAAVQLKFRTLADKDRAFAELRSGAIELLLAPEPPPGAQSGRMENDRAPADRRSAGPEEETADFAPQALGRVELGRMAAGVIVHPDNPLESLPLDEAKAVFGGRIRNWPAAKGAGAPIHVVGLGRSDPITRLVKEALAPDAAEGPWKYTAQADTAKVILAVARDPAAIGFVDMSQLPPNEKSVRAVRITATERRTKAAEGTAGGPRASGPHESQGRASQPGDRGASESETREIAQLMPPRADALPEDYPLARTLTLYVSPKASQVAKDFADFLTPEHCKETIARYNLLPPLRAEATKLAGRPHPNPLPKGEGTRLALADEPVPLLLDAPDAPPDQPEAKAKKTVAKAKPEATTSEQPEPAEPASDAKPVAASEPASKPAQKQPEASSLSDKEIVWIVCGVGGAVILAIGIGWLQAPNRKKPRRAP